MEGLGFDIAVISLVFTPPQVTPAVIHISPYGRNLSVGQYVNNRMQA